MCSLYVTTKAGQSLQACSTRSSQAGARAPPQMSAKRKRVAHMLQQKLVEGSRREAQGAARQAYKQTSERNYVQQALDFPNWKRRAHRPVLTLQIKT